MEDLKIHVIEFLSLWADGIDGIKLSFRKYMAEDIVYENIGLTLTTNITQAIAMIDNFLPGMNSIDVEILSIAQDGDKILTERIDYIKDSFGATLATIRLMGIFEFSGNRIIGWRDYFDTSPFKSKS